MKVKQPPAPAVAPSPTRAAAAPAPAAPAAPSAPGSKGWGAAKGGADAKGWAPGAGAKRPPEAGPRGSAGAPAQARSPSAAASSAPPPSFNSSSVTHAAGARAAAPPKASLAPAPGQSVIPSRYATPAFTAALDAQTASRRVDGNRVTMLFDGVNSFAERDKMIDSAKESICLQTFIFTSDETGWALANKLAEKAKQGVEVRVIIDAMGSGRADPKMFDVMRQAGVDVREWAPKWKVWDLNDRWHEKHLIVDGKASVEGGMNIANEYAFGGSGKQVLSRGQKGSEAWRDADIKLEGPAVQDATKAFLRNWAELDGTVSDAQRARLLPKLEPLKGGATVRVVQSNPQVGGLDRTTEKLYLRAIENAKSRITIENAYFLPPLDIRKALLDAAKRGVDVRVLTNSKASNDMGFVSDAARYFYDDLIKAGVKVYEKQGGTLHTKTASFDGEYSIVGSFNMNGRSVNQDAEVALGVEDGATAKQLDARFEAGLSKAKPVTLGELKREDFLTNVKQWALSTLAWTF